MKHRFAKGARGALPPVLLFAVSAIICRHLFFTAYINQMGAGDGPLIAMASYVLRHGDAAWWPIWFAGEPLQNVYGPLPRLVIAAGAALLGRSPAWTLHTLGALFYCLGPLTLAWAVEKLSGSRIWALAAGLLFAVTSPAALLAPSIRADVGGIFHLRRLYDMVVYGEYPHVALLTLMPVALVVFERLRRRGARLWILAGAGLLAVFAASSVTASVGLALLLLAWLAALPAVDWLRSLAWGTLAACLAYGLTLPWLPPSTIRLIAFNSQWGAGRATPFTASHLLYGVLIAAGAAVLRWGMMRLGVPQLLRFALLVVYLCGGLMLADMAAGLAILPQPYRFQLEFEMGCCLAGGYLWWKTAGKMRPRFQVLLGAALVLPLVAINATHAGRYIRSIEIRRTLEYQSARWFDRNLEGGRVFAPGSVSFWMNVFTDTPQLGGCCDQGVPSWEDRVALYSIYTGQNMGAREGPVSLLWLQAFGVQAVEITGPGGREFYKPYRNPRKFDGLLPMLWQDGPDVIYRVPQRSGSLAHVMRQPQVVPVAGRPKDGLDVGPLGTYVAALNDPSFAAADFRWQGPSRARIVAEAAPDDVISVQVSYDRGWRARVKGADIPVTSDGLGLMVLHPRCVGRCEIDLEYDGGPEMRWARIVRILALLACLAIAAPALLPLP